MFLWVAISWLSFAYLTFKNKQSDITEWHYRVTSTPTVLTQNGRRIPWHGLHDIWKYSQLKYILVIIQYILDIQYRELNSLKSPLSRTAQLQITQNYDRRGGGGPRKYLTLRRDRRTLLRRNVDVILQNFPKLQTEYVEMERRQGKVRLDWAMRHIVLELLDIPQNSLLATCRHY